MSNFTYRKDHIPKGTACNRRPGFAMSPTTITIHNTANEKSSAANERAWLTNQSNKVQASYHIVVDEREAIECIPLNENAWHAGDGSGSASGNRTSIGIEICESGNYAKTIDNAVTLIAQMLLVRGWGVDRLRRHWDWSRKICPRLMYDGGTWSGWYAFKAAVQGRLNELKKEDVAVSDNVTVIVNGKSIKDGKLEGGTVYVPLRAVGEAIGAKIGWDNKSKTAKLDTQ
ncbi:MULTISPECIES: N-acetylmuramoyl-L-alanine amidase [Paenibacillus]|uniref:N-acetylmuramoyl-L-alanine amidase n=2 Tax=Paenibacillus TaxID=44249 RepID=UPI0011A43D0C|nr:N-acetylmuramoyl-L-alanine amidase [Paenibacillus sp. IHBB 10380]